MIDFTTIAEYCTWAGTNQANLPGDFQRQIRRASELIYEKTFLAWTYPTLTIDVPTAVNEATCAQLEYWLLETGEGYDRLPDKETPILAPRAKRLLWLGGYLNRTVYATDTWISGEENEDTE